MTTAPTTIINVRLFLLISPAMYSALDVGCWGGNEVVFAPGGTLVAIDDLVANGAILEVARAPDTTVLFGGPFGIP